MDLNSQFELEHLFLTERKCRVCGKVKDLLDGFYLTRKYKRSLPSAYSYECKNCTSLRVMNSKKTSKKKSNNHWEYPDW
jgi:hypothetical protein